MWAKIRELGRTLSRKRADIALVIMWAAIVAFFVIKAYWLSYSTSPRLIYMKPAHPTYDLVGVSWLDLLFVAVSGVVVGLFLSDVKEMFYGYITAIFTAFVISITYVALYIWYVLDMGLLFALSDYGWEWAVYISSSIVFTLMVPWIVCTCLVSLTIGAFLRTWVIESFFI